MTLLDRARQQSSSNLIRLAGGAAVLALAFVLGFLASSRWLLLLVGAMGAAAIVRYPSAGLLVLVLAALFVPAEIRTGTAVQLNAASLLVPVLLTIWLLDMLRRGQVRLTPSNTNRPLLLFLLACLLSLLIGLGTWDPSVPRPSGFILIQLAQWTIFFLSAGAYWLGGNLIRDQGTLKRLTFVCLALYGVAVILFTYPQLLPGTAKIAGWVNGMLTFGFHRAPFWLLLAAIAGGQLLFNDELPSGWRFFLMLVLGGVLIYVLHLMRRNAANWMGVAAVAGILAWLRWPRLRWPAILLLVALAVSGVMSSAVYEFAGGDEEWVSSGASRLVLIGRVVEVSLRNPITGLGPAAYRLYAAREPLRYGLALWVNPSISSHNNYVDLFAHGGILGLGLFAWFAVEVARMGLRLRARFRHGFAAGYVNGMLAAGAGALVLMLVLDWILPFVYNTGFMGFQASVLIWLFMGGLLVLERMVDTDLVSGAGIEQRQVEYNGAS